MTTSVNAVGFDFEKDQLDLINKKIERIKYAEDLIVDFALKVKEDKKFIFDATVHFRWGSVAHVSAEDYDFAAALNKMMDTLDQKVHKEKEKIQEKK